MKLPPTDPSRAAVRVPMPGMERETQTANSLTASHTSEAPDKDTACKLLFDNQAKGIPSWLSDRLVTQVATVVDRLSNPRSKKAGDAVLELIELCRDVIAPLEEFYGQRAGASAQEILEAVSGYDLSSVRGEPEGNAEIIKRLSELVLGKEESDE